jgi:hypothetical protein
MAAWDELTKTKQLQLASHLARGRTNGGSINRAMEALAEDKGLLYRVAKELGIENEVDAAKEMSIEDRVDRYIKPVIPKPKDNEPSGEYLERVRNTIFEDPVFGYVETVEGEL